MKQNIKIFLIVFIVVCGLNTNCKADTIDNYQIYIGKILKLTEESFNPLRSTLPFLKLDSSNYSETININFSHCTHGASNRQLKITDTAENTIILWQFGDKEQKPLMSIPINEILTNEKIRKNTSLNLYYVDKEYPVWRLLTSVYVGQFIIEKEVKQNPSKKFNKMTFLYLIPALTIIFLVFRIVRQRSPNR